MSSTDDEEGRGGRKPGFLVVEAILGFGLLLSRKSLQMVEPPFQAKYGGGGRPRLYVSVGLVSKTCIAARS